VFLSSSEDDTGVLDVIEEKIARASMIPMAHGEVGTSEATKFLKHSSPSSIPDLYFIGSGINCSPQLYMYIV